MNLKYKYYHGNKTALIEKIKSLLNKEKDILLAIIFGSFVDLNSFRDIDLAIYSTKKDFNYYTQLSAKLELQLKLPIDVIPLNELSPIFRRKILSKGIITIERIPGLYEALLNQANDEITLQNYSNK